MIKKKYNWESIINNDTSRLEQKMKYENISVIIPVYNEEKTISGCLRALINQDYPMQNYEIIVVNDGSTDGTLREIRKKQKESKEKKVTLRIINLEKNGGRVIARETGAKNARNDLLLFTDSRCIANKDVLTVTSKLNYQPIVGNAVTDPNRSVFDRFFWLIRKKLYSSHFGEKITPTYITKKNFDNMRKGTTIFICEKKLFLSFQDNNKYASDDIKLLWNIVKKKKILKHPDIKVSYLSRTSIKGEIKHTFERGPKFVDYYLNPRKKRFWLFILLPLMAFVLFLSLIIVTFVYYLFWILAIVLILVIVSLWIAENMRDFFIVFFFLPIIAASFELGIVKGLIIKLNHKLWYSK
ncbi:MAG: glycosyltransferase family 2 protein [Ignavibacteriales bacterium]|nr:MAG: glycosyltransferase family 2 protein [Ignavibacteriales bacterium]